MAKMIQLRHVPDALHRKLKARAAMEGLSLSEYLVQKVTQIAEQPTLEELRRRLEERSPVRVRTSPRRAVRAERDRR